MRPLKADDITYRDAITPTLRVTTWAGVASGLQVRGFTKDQPFQLVHATTANRAYSQTSLPISDFPMSVTVIPDSGIHYRGQCFVLVDLQLGGLTVATLIADYVHLGKYLAYPGGTIKSSTEGRGYIRLVTGTDPAIAAEISEAVPSNALWRLISLYLNLDTDANAANRKTDVIFTDGTDEFWRCRTATAVTANTVFKLIFSAGLGAQEFTQGYIIHHPLPELFLPEGYTIDTVTDVIQVGDDYDAPLMFVEEWIVE